MSSCEDCGSDLICAECDLPDLSVAARGMAAARRVASENRRLAARRFDRARTEPASGWITPDMVKRECGFYTCVACGDLHRFGTERPCGSKPSPADAEDARVEEALRAIRAAVARIERHRRAKAAAWDVAQPLIENLVETCGDVDRQCAELRAEIDRIYRDREEAAAEKPRPDGAGTGADAGEAV